MAEKRRRRKWRIGSSDDIRNWVENGNELTAIATRAQLQPMPGQDNRGTGSGTGGTSGTSSSTGSGTGGTSGTSSSTSDTSGTSSSTSGTSSSTSGTSGTGGTGGTGSTSKTSKAVKAELSALKQLDIIAFNQRVEQLFVSLLRALIIERHGEITVIEAIRECAYELDISTETAKRYILKHTASAAEFSIVSKVLRLRG